MSGQRQAIAMRRCWIDAITWRDRVIADGRVEGAVRMTIEFKTLAEGRLFDPTRIQSRAGYLRAAKRSGRRCRMLRDRARTLWNRERLSRWDQPRELKVGLGAGLRSRAVQWLMVAFGSQRWRNEMIDCWLSVDVDEPKDHVVGHGSAVAVGFLNFDCAG
jgi:hypothetical protein